MVCTVTVTVTVTGVCIYRIGVRRVRVQINCCKMGGVAVAVAVGVCVFVCVGGFVVVIVVRRIYRAR